MVDTDKVYLMTKAALFEEKERKNALHTVYYRRKDYVRYHLMLIFLSVTIAYAIIVGAILFMIVMAYDSIVLNLTEMILISVIVLAGYVLMLTFYYVAAYKYYGDKHIKARKDVREYLSYLRKLNALYEKEDKEER